jgi:hypothetical protein
LRWRHYVHDQMIGHPRSRFQWVFAPTARRCRRFAAGGRQSRVKSREPDVVARGEPSTRRGG